MFGNARRIQTGGGGVAEAEALHIAGEDLAAGENDLVGDQHTLFAQLVAQLAAFTAGSGTHVQDPPIGPDLQTFRRCHGAGVLHVDHACMMEGVVAHFAVIEIEAGLHIGDRPGGKGIDFRKILHGDLFRIDAEGPHRILAVRILIKGKFLFAHERLHSCCKLNG